VNVCGIYNEWALPITSTLPDWATLAFAFGFWCTTCDGHDWSQQLTSPFKQSSIAIPFQTRHDRQQQKSVKCYSHGWRAPCFTKPRDCEGRCGLAPNWVTGFLT
jgi:hypothetical protein